MSESTRRIRKKTKDTKATALYILLIVIFVAILLISIYMLMYVPINGKAIERKSEELREKLKHGPLQSLMNGSGINNIPNLSLVTNNEEISRANKCSEKPLLVGSSGVTQDECVRICANSSANVINVQDGELYLYEQQTLSPGFYCTIGPRPECNTKTSIPVMTVNSVTCRSKFPRLVGGPLGTTIVACNNSQINDQKNILWDYKNNKAFDPLSTVITNQNERLPDNQYRFRCKFNGVDERNNQYIRHPLDRFQPIRNYCASSIYSAHPDVRTVYSKDNKSFTCDCGDFKETRVTNMTDAKNSICSHIKSETKTDVGDRKLLTLPYKCFTLYSTLDDVGKYPPCNNEQFTRQGSQMSSVTIPYTHKLNHMIDHPIYDKLIDKEFYIPRVGTNVS